MSITHEWQLVAHAPKMSPASGAVANAIARRIRPDKDREPIPQRTLLVESIGVQSKRTIERALSDLKELGVIDIKPGFQRKPNLIVWRLECPENCNINHERGNAQKEIRDKTRPNPVQLCPNPDDPLTSVNNREKGEIFFEVEKALTQLKEPNGYQLKLIEGLKDKTQRPLIRIRLDELALKADKNATNYCKSIALEEPWQLLPKEKAPQKPPNFDNYPLQLRAEIEENYLREAEANK